jgi:hypothetical protein
MDKRVEYITLGLLLLGIWSSTIFAQTEVKVLHLRDGSTIQGKIVAQDDSTLVLETSYGTLEIQRTNILNQEPSMQTPGKPITLWPDGSFIVTLQTGQSDTILSGIVRLEYLTGLHNDSVLYFKGVLGIAEDLSGEFDHTSTVITSNQVFYVKVDTAILYKARVVGNPGNEVILEFSRSQSMVGHLENATDNSNTGRKALGVLAIIAGTGFGIAGGAILNPNNNLKNDSEYGVMAIADGIGLVALGIWLLSTPNGAK